MKRIALIVALGLITTSNVWAEKHPNLSKEISKKVRVDLNSVSANVSDRDFVKVSFTVEEGRIKVLEINSTQKALEELIVKELNDIKLSSCISCGKVYYYKFTFSKQ